MPLIPKTVRMTQADADLLRRLAELDDRSEASLIRALLHRAAREKGIQPAPTPSR